MIASSDAATDLFPLLQLRGVVCGHADLRPPWSIRQQATGRHWLYVAQKGSCWIQLIEQQREAIRIDPGDALAVANDAPHWIRDDPSLAARDTEAALELRTPAARAPETDEGTVLFVASVAVAAARLSDLFPTLFHVPAERSRHDRRIGDLVRLMEEEIAGPAAAGSGSVVDRLADLVLIELFRVETQRTHPASPVWIHGIVDHAVARLVTRFHAEPARHWTWESMGRAAGLSRSALDRRFRSVLGQSPKRYLLTLRMRLAAAALAEGRRSITEIASLVGYESEPAFHRAFRRTLGLTPGSYARAPKP